jgi:uncharacterized membrane protein YphA (DoxX/SURF4 family)
MNYFHHLMGSSGPRSVILVRLIVGATFLSEGIQKFLYPVKLGVGRFVEYHIPYPDFFAPFVGVCEIICGCLLLVGFMTRLAAIPMIANISVAIITTKLSILLKPIVLNGVVQGRTVEFADKFWTMAHEARVDFAMLLGGIFLLIVGAGPWSVDGFLLRRQSRSTPDVDGAGRK